MNIFKAIRNSIKLRRLHKIVRELCTDKHSCRNCPGLILQGSVCGKNCALSAAIDIALDRWGLEE